MSRQIQTRIDTLLPSPAHIAQGKQSQMVTQSQLSAEPENVAKVTRYYKTGDPVYAIYHGPHRDKEPRWVPAVILKSMGTCCFHVRVIPHGPMWRWYWEQLHPHYTSDEDNEPGEAVDISEQPIDHPMEIDVPSTQRQTRQRIPTTKPPSPEYGPGNPRQSKRTPKPIEMLCCD